jgi:hypothetical protein
MKLAEILVKFRAENLEDVVLSLYSQKKAPKSNQGNDLVFKHGMFMQDMRL